MASLPGGRHMGNVVNCIFYDVFERGFRRSGYFCLYLPVVIFVLIFIYIFMYLYRYDVPMLPDCIYPSNQPPASLRLN